MNRISRAELDKGIYDNIPEVIHKTIIVDYMFKDIFVRYKRFFNEGIMKEKEMLYDFSMGFQPRMFNGSESFDSSIIYEENQEVSEMYFVYEGVVTIGFDIVTGNLNYP